MAVSGLRNAAVHYRTIEFRTGVAACATGIAGAIRARGAVNSCVHGVSRRQAIRHGKSRKGYWHMAKTIASGVGMMNKWLQEQGLVSLKSLWASLAPLR